MDDRRRGSDDAPGDARAQLGSAPTTPAPEHTLAPGADDALARGSAGGTRDLPADDVVAAAREPEAPPRHRAERYDGDVVALGHFRVKMRLGAGGMGVVYAGEDANLGRSVAIKVVRSDADHPAYRARLLREAQAMARLEHPNVVRVYHIGEDQGRLFVAMELVEGMTLTAWLRDPHGWREIVAMFEQVGQGLAAVHAAGLVHRDFKPDNVLVDHAGHARVADFGLARLDHDEGGASPMAASLTKTGALMGTPGYMAPEQQFGGDVDARADQYSFCVALREALGGRPLDAKRWAAVPRGVRAVVTRGLAYDPDERFASLQALLAALRTAAGGGKQRGVVIAACAVLVSAGAVLAFARSKPPPQAPPAAGSAVAMTEAHDAGAVQLADAGVPQVVAADAAPERIAAIVDAAVVPKHVVAKVRPDASPGESAAAGPIEFAPPENDLTKDYKALRTAAAKVGDPSHLPLVRKTIANLGYAGVDVAALDRDALETEIAGATDLAKDIATTKLAMLERRRGNCAKAEELIRETRILSSQGDDAKLWMARGAFTFALCEIAEDRSDDAYHVIMKATLAGDQDEVRFAMAIISYERDNHEDAHARMIAASHSTNPRVRAALKLWLDGTGLVL